MIRIHRPTSPPAALRKAGQRETDRFCEEYDADPAGYDSGTQKFQPHAYSRPSVRKKLKECQHNKCCYSEARFVAEAVHIEHFRPKGAIRDQGTSTRTYPGYYWLANDWENLLACKAGVNSVKGDLFPVRDEAARARNHHDDIGKECPMLIDPSSENPRDHIRFYNEQPYGITDRGKVTVELLLEHPELVELRLERYHRLMDLKKALAVSVRHGESDLAAEIRDTLDDACQQDAEFSSMAIDFLT